MKRQISARRLWLTSFPIMVMAIMVVSMFCCHAVHGLLDAQFGIFPSVGFVTAFLQIGVAFFLLRRDKPLAVECIVSAFTVIVLLVLSIPAHALPHPFFR